MKERILNILVLVLLLVATLLNWSWPWGVLLVYGTIPAYSTGRVLLVGDVERDKEPLLFGAILIFWVLGGLAMIVMDPLVLALLGMGG